MSGISEEQKRRWYYWMQTNDKVIVRDKVREAKGSLFGDWEQRDRVGFYKDNLKDSGFYSE